MEHLVFEANIPNSTNSAEEEKRAACLLCQFVVNIRPTKKRTLHGKFVKGDGNISPVTLKSYLLSIQRVLRKELLVRDMNLMRIPGLKMVADNRFRELQSKGNMSESYNTLSIDDLCTILDYLNESARHCATSYRDRLVFCVGLATGLIVTALRLISLDQLREESVRGVLCIVFRSVMGAMDGQSKTEGGGWNRVGTRARVFPIPNEIVCVVVLISMALSKNTLIFVELLRRSLTDSFLVSRREVKMCPVETRHVISRSKIWGEIHLLVLLRVYGQD